MPEQLQQRVEAVEAQVEADQKLRTSEGFKEMVSEVIGDQVLPEEMRERIEAVQQAIDAVTCLLPGYYVPVTRGLHDACSLPHRGHAEAIKAVA